MLAVQRDESALVPEAEVQLRAYAEDQTCHLLFDYA